MGISNIQSFKLGIGHHPRPSPNIHSHPHTNPILNY